MKPGVTALFVGALYCILGSCGKNTGTKTQLISEIDSFKTELIEKQIGNSDFYISIPTNFVIKESRGPDFSVYYFNLSDTMIKPTYVCGIYFGNWPSKFKWDSCTVETSKGKILDNNVDWTIYNCKEGYSVQTITDNKNNDHWNQKIHAFGNGATRKEMEKVMCIFSTMRKKQS